MSYTLALGSKEVYIVSSTWGPKMSNNKGFHGRSTQKWQPQDRRGSNWTPNRNLNSYNNSSWNNTVGGSSQAGVKP